MSTISLDDAVGATSADLRERGFPPPRALLLLGTGIEGFAARLARTCELELGDVAGVPEPWNAGVLVGGGLEHLPVWVLEDASGEPLELEPSQGWVRGFPLWLAAASGASIAVHTSAGCGLLGGPAAGGFALLSDHVNASGSTPLLGLAGSRLGPLFPDLSRLHHVGLRRAALARAEALGLAAGETVGACTNGPALETPAELAMLATLGAGVAVQSLAAPLLAAAHAGLAVLALVAVLDDAAERPLLARLVERAARQQAALQELLVALAPDLAAAAEAHVQEVGS